MSPAHEQIHTRMPSLPDRNYWNPSCGTRHLNLQTRTWKVINPHVKNVVGEPVAYRSYPATTASRWPPGRLVAETRGVRRKSRLGDALRGAEKYAAGDYPNQSRGGDGLINWTAAIDRLRIRTWCSGTPSATPTSRDRKITR